MNIESIKNQLPENAKDARVNFERVLSEEGAPELSLEQIQGVAMASAYALQHQGLIDAVSEGASDAVKEAAQQAAMTMGMSNIYYRFAFGVNDPELIKMPVNLRMQGMQNPPVSDIDFELMTLVVSAINGCGKCMNAHKAKLEKVSGSKVALQSAVRIASVLHQVKQALALA